jgi:ComF family protein
MPVLAPSSSLSRTPRVPGQCAVCRGWTGAAVCTACVGRFAAPQPRCGRCGLRLAVPAPACGACLAAPPPFTACVVACDYAFPWDRLIAAFKFEARVELAAPLADRLVQALRDSDAARPDWVVPVPLAPRRLAERGYNQAWELARRVADALHLPSRASLLQRHAEGEHQAALGLAERRRNLRGAFIAGGDRQVSLHGAHVAVVDDVMTSGATLAEAALALQRAGVRRVDAWALARTPARDG